MCDFNSPEISPRDNANAFLSAYKRPKITVGTWKGVDF